jgi:SAM-dependent methyltransferase
MEYKGSTVYDNDEFFNHYMKRRHRAESPNAIIEKPSLLELLGNVKDKIILDLGCGDASLGLELLKNQCSSYIGIDGSKNMCKKASQNLEGTNGEVFPSTMEEYEYPPLAFDVVVSQLAIHYIEDFGILAKNVFNTLKKGGNFVFSVQHPLLTSSFESLTTSGKRFNWIVDDYFHSGKRVEPWIGEQVVKYHRTIEEYFISLQNAGFVMSGIREATPKKENFDSNDEYERRMRIPLFLLFSCTKPLNKNKLDVCS